MQRDFLMENFANVVRFQGIFIYFPQKNHHI